MRRCGLTDDTPTDDGADVPSLQLLIRSRMDERGLTFPELERASGLGKSRWHQLASGKRMRTWPDPDTLRLIADTLGYDHTTIVLATAQSLGLEVRTRGSLFSQLLPTGTDLLSPDTREALLSLVRAVVADALGRQHEQETAEGADPERPDGQRVGIRRRNAASSGGNTLHQTADTEP